jgi:GT2 family glycosyltransferase
MKTEHYGEIKTQEFYESGFISVCAMLIRREVFKSIGLLDEDYFLYWEDADFSFRAKYAGFALLVVPEIRITHLEKSEEKKENKIYWLVISGLIFFRKNSTGLMKLWTRVYYQLRKLKNRRDIKNGGDELALAVKRAYSDFDRYGK